MLTLLIAGSVVAAASTQGDVPFPFGEAVQEMYHGKGQKLAAMVDALAPGDTSVDVNAQVAMPDSAGGGSCTALLVSLRAAAQGKPEGLAVAKALLLTRDDIARDAEQGQGDAADDGRLLGRQGAGRRHGRWGAHDAASWLSRADLQAAPMPFRPSQASL